jgi:hypothetical protein
MKIATMMLGAVVLCGAIASPMAAHAADRDFCRAYTEAAVRQASEARQSRYCARQIPYEPARWSLDRRGHFDWCRRSPRLEAEAERGYRADFLRDCRRRR